MYITAILVPYKMAASMRKFYTSSIVYGARQTEANERSLLNLNHLGVGLMAITRYAVAL